MNTDYAFRVTHPDQFDVITFTAVDARRIATVIPNALHQFDGENETRVERDDHAVTVTQSTLSEDCWKCECTVAGDTHVCITQHIADLTGAFDTEGMILCPDCAEDFADRLGKYADNNADKLAEGL